MYASNQAKAEAARGAVRVAFFAHLYPVDPSPRVTRLTAIDQCGHKEYMCSAYRGYSDTHAPLVSEELVPGHVYPYMPHMTLSMA